jgi:16S rRNA A1518/A1519 N6-dimethyltransferase RsmA/KsgA/DIM1 with predicted DNA glycosylase/AP lyase activity
MVGNLPYNVSTVLLLKWLRQIPNREGAFHFGPSPMTLLFQKEVADRIASRPGTSQYGRLGVMTQQSCHVTSLFNIPNTVFVPAPKVDGSVISIAPDWDAWQSQRGLSTDLVTPPSLLSPPSPSSSSSSSLSSSSSSYSLVHLEHLLQRCFMYRRKQIRRTLADISPEFVQRLTEEGFDLSRRPEDLSVGEWCHLASLFGSLGIETVDFGNEKREKRRLKTAERVEREKALGLGEEKEEEDEEEEMFS